MSFEIKPATRQGIRPLICLYGESGSGKSYSSLLLARGYVGPNGKIAMIDSESGRGSLYADVLPGGYDVLNLDEPFTPDRYVLAIDAVEKSGAAIGVLDSGSHEWEMGVLDMAVSSEQASGKPGLHNWKIPKMEHAKFVQKLLRSTIPWIICLRAKHKTRQAKDERGRTVIVKDPFTTPLQADDFIFEMTAHGEVMPDHSFRLTKCSHPSLMQCFPEKGPICIEHGQELAQWCASPTGVFAPKPNKIASMKRHLWKLTEQIHSGDAAKLEQWLIASMIITDSETMANLTAERLDEVINAVTEKLKESNGKA